VQVVASLVSKYTETLFIKARSEHRKQLARVGLERNVPIQRLVADLLLAQRSHARQRPLASRFGARADSNKRT